MPSLHLIVEASKEKKKKQKQNLSAADNSAEEEKTRLRLQISTHSGIVAWSSPWSFSRGHLTGDGGAQLETNASTVHDDFGTIGGIFWKQFKQQQMVAGLF